MMARLSAPVSLPQLWDLAVGPSPSTRIGRIQTIFDCIRTLDYRCPPLDSYGRSSDSPDRLFYRDIPEAETFGQLAITKDGRHILQRNSNRHLYIYDVVKERLVLRGFDIDDELIIYDQRGYFVATPEGSQFVYFKFPGLPGYSSFHQFARTLNRPDLIRRILSGEADTPDPQLAAPPTVDFNLTISGSEANRSTNLNVTATSDIGLEKVLVFVDGSLAAHAPVEGQKASPERRSVSLGLSRWVTLVQRGHYRT